MEKGLRRKKEGKKMLNESMEQFIREHKEEAFELLRTIGRIPAPSNHE